MSPSPTRSRRRAWTTPATSSPKGTDRTVIPLAALLLILAAALFNGCGGEEDSGAPTPAETEAGVTEPTTGQEADTEGSPPANGKGGVVLTALGSFEAPLYVTQPPSGSDDLYVVEQGGRIQELAPDGDVRTFLDISDVISSGGERGLLSVAFAPDYERSGLFYVDYTDEAGDTRVVEYKAEDGIVDESSARELLRVEQPYANHNGGLVLFGPDEKLYIGLGDGGSGGDPERRGLDLSTPLGKILRIDPKPDGDLPYTIPEDNPFVGTADAREEIYSYGLRNPWRFAFDRETDELTIGDVGQDSQEEIDVVAKGEGSGASFGWSAFEGTEEFNDDQSSPDAIEPALIASHEEGNCSITGGLTVRDPELPTLYGRYLWGDLCVGELRSFTPVPGETASDDVPLGLDVPQIASFGEDAKGSVYAVSIAGSVYRLDPAERNG